MTIHIEQGVASAAPTPCSVTSGPSFDPDLWLAAVAQIGGGYALASNRKLVLMVQDCQDRDLAPLMAQVAGNADRLDAVRTAIELRQMGGAA